MNGLLAGTVAVVTGAAQALGATFALALAKEGASVVVGGANPTDATCAASRRPEVGRLGWNST